MIDCADESEDFGSEAAKHASGTARTTVTLAPVLSGTAWPARGLQNKLTHIALYVYRNHRIEYSKLLIDCIMMKAFLVNLYRLVRNTIGDFRGPTAQFEARTCCH